MDRNRIPSPLPWSPALVLQVVLTPLASLGVLTTVEPTCRSWRSSSTTCWQQNGAQAVRTTGSSRPELHGGQVAGQRGTQAPRLPRCDIGVDFVKGGQHARRQDETR